MPVYNRANIIAETLDSILKQEHPHWECIIVDDGSADNTKEVAGKYAKQDSRFRLYDRPENYKPGGNGGRNYALKISNGEFIQYFDSDDLMHEKLLSRKCEVFQNDPDVQCVISPLTFFEGDKITGVTPIDIKYDLIYENTITWKIPAWGVSPMFRKKLLVDCNAEWDETLERLPDYDLYSKIFVKYEPKTAIIDDELIFIRRNHPDAITTTFLKVKEITELEKSEYIVAKRIIDLLIKEDKFTINLEKHFYRDHKRRITRLRLAGDREIIGLYKDSVESFLNFNHKQFKILRFRIGYALLRQIPINNLFLIYQPPATLVRLKKILFTKGYLKSKLLKKRGRR